MTARQQHANDTDQRSGAGANGRATAPIRRRTDGGASRSGRSNGCRIAALRGGTIPVKQLRLNRCGLAVCQREVGLLDAQVRDTLHATGLFGFHNLSTDRLSGLRDNHAVYDHRPYQRRGEGISWLVTVRRETLI